VVTGAVGMAVAHPLVVLAAAVVAVLVAMARRVPDLLMMDRAGAGPHDATDDSVDSARTIRAAVKRMSRSSHQATARSQQSGGDQARAALASIASPSSSHEPGGR
jgi:ABC-type hemin transport system ATPase subunit